MKKYTPFLWIFGIILFLLLSTPFIFYICNFHKEPISSNPADWGTFGDFVGGLLNAVLGVINIMVLLYLTFKIASIEDERNSNALTLQENLAINEIKFVAYKEVNTFFLGLSKKMLNEDDFGNQSYSLDKIEFFTVVSPYLDLFKCFNPDRLNQMGQTIFDLDKFKTIIGNDEENKVTLQSTMKNTYIKEYTEFLNDMRQELHS